ncbi:unnamed protein product, partial [Heterotrigona itama]
MAGQTINDRLLAARHSIAGQGLAKAVCKATTEEMIGPKKKHLECKFNRFDTSKIFSIGNSDYRVVGSTSGSSWRKYCYILCDNKYFMFEISIFMDGLLTHERGILNEHAFRLQNVSSVPHFAENSNESTVHVRKPTYLGSCT